MNIFLLVTLIGVYIFSQGTECLHFSNIFSSQKEKCATQERKFLSSEKQNEVFECFPSNVKCDPNSKYRTINGECNNLQFPQWGSANTAFVRIADPFYNGKIGYRKSVNSKDLPLARKISTTLFTPDRVDRTKDKTLFVISFGQVIAHDTVGTSDLNRPECCTADFQKVANYNETECASMIVPSDDPFYSKFKATCLGVVQRHNNTLFLKNCNSKSPHPLQTLTSYVDLSFVYGSIESVARSMRAFKGGQLLTGKTIEGHGSTIRQTTNGCSREEACFSAGDSRINQNPEVVVSTSLFWFSHNYIANKLAAKHPDYDDEKLFQEARRINIAAYQHVVYDEYLPAVLGTKNIEKRGLLSLKHGYNVNPGYKADLNAQTLTSFASAAFRTPHTMHYTNVTLRDKNYKTIGYYLNKDHFNNESFLAHDDVLQQAIRGLSKDLCLQRGSRNDLFEHNFEILFNPGKFGSDLIATDIIRNRDDGLPPYNEFRRICGLCPAKKFKDLTNYMKSEDVGKLEKLYDSVDDIDFTVGALLENPVEYSTFGPTAQCVVEEGFYRWKFGDRFFYEFSNKGISFTPEQLQSIRKTTLSSFVCLTMNNNEVQVQKNMFFKESASNPMIPCSKIPFVDLNLF